MAELVDAPDSKSGIGNNVQVRFLFWAPATQINKMRINILRWFSFVYVPYGFLSVRIGFPNRIYIAPNRCTQIKKWVKKMRESL
jgi:hypothetical protein